jgi:hypothetical protein
MFNQLGQFYTCVTFTPRIFILHSECSGLISYSKHARALTGGKNGSPEKLYFNVSSNTLSKPVRFSLSDNFKSDFKHLRNMA